MVTAAGERRRGDGAGEIKQSTVRPRPRAERGAAAGCGHGHGSAAHLNVNTIQDVQLCMA